MEKSSSANPLFSVYLIVLALSVSRVSGGITVSPSSPVKVDESAGILTVTVTNDMLPGAGFWGFTSLTSDETATAGSDYTSLASTLSQVPSSQPSVNLTVSITDDNDLDPGETFLLMLKDFFSGESDINVTICINDNELAPVELKQPGNITVKEGQFNNNITLTLERADASTRNFTVHIQIQAGTAVPDQDIAHEGIEKWFEFAENETSKTIPLASLINDLIEEPSEVFTVVITGPDLKDNITVHVTIKDNDSEFTITTNPPDPFHCGRGKSQPCLNNGTCTDEGCHPSTGYCNCTTGFSGVNCGIDDTVSTCNQACVNGTCVNGACICDPGFAGELCDKNAYYHQCNPTNFSVCITPFSLDTFCGVVYVKNFQNVSECNLTLAPNQAAPSDGIVDWCKGYAAAIPYNGTCGELGPTFDGNYTSYELSLLVQYTSGIKSCTDEKVTFTCRYDNNSLHIVNTYDVDPNSFHDGSVVRETANYVPAILTSTAADGSSLTPPLALGTTVKIYISVKEIPGFHGIVIHKITVHNNRPIPDKRSITLYDKGCIPDTAAGILTVSPFFTPTGEKHTICFAIRIFVFDHDIYLANPVLAVKVYFKVVGHDALSGAELPTCGSRKKRQADDDEKSLSTTFTITITDGGEKAVRTSLDRSTDNKSVMVPIVVGLGSLAIAVAVVAIAVGFIISKRRRRSKLTEKDDLSYSSR